MSKPTLISTMTEAGIAYYGGGKDPREVIRAAKNRASMGSVFRRELETILKQDMIYLDRAFSYLVTKP